METEREAQERAAELTRHAIHTGMTPHVYETWHRHGDEWRKTGRYGIRFHKIGGSPAVFEDGGFRMTPVENSPPADPVGPLGRAVAAAVRAGDGERLEALAIHAGTYDVLRIAAQAAGVDLDELEEALAAI